MNKKKLFKFSLVALCLTFVLNTKLIAQDDTIRVMQYNLFRYGETNKEPSVKNPLLINIVNHIQPDIIGVNELSAVADYAQNVLNGALNVNGITKWRRASLSKAGVDKSLTNTVFYDVNKFKLLNQDTVSIVQREITAFNFMYNDSNISITKDTIFFSVIVLHFKAGNTSSDAATRANEATQIVNYINSFSKAKNIMVMGDYNVYTNTEAGFSNLVLNTNAINKLVDPINRLGAWNNNSTFADIHTQSTHSTQTGGFSSGGMDDRFDILLCTKSLLQDSLKMYYVPGTYKAVGNDGQHFNLAINDAPLNTSVPSTVLGALYNMSDHLPIVADFAIKPMKPLPQGVEGIKKKRTSEIQIENPVKSNLNIHVSAFYLNENLKFELYNLNAQKIESFEIRFDDNDKKYEWKNSSLKGMYILNIIDEDGYHIQKKIVFN